MIHFLATFACLLRACSSACCRPRCRRRQAEGNPDRLGDLQSGLDGAEGRRASSRRNSPRTASRSAGCRRSAPTRRWSSSTPASIDFGSTAGAAALVGKINGNPIKSIYVYSRPEWTALVTRKEPTITKVADLKGKRVAVTRGTDPHIFLVRALAERRPDREGRHAVLLQHRGRQDRAHCAATSMPGPASIR